jgi:hypothetical protein
VATIQVGENSHFLVTWNIFSTCMFHPIKVLMIFIRIIVSIWSKLTDHLTREHLAKECFCKDMLDSLKHSPLHLHFVRISCYVSHSHHMQANLHMGWWPGFKNIQIVEQWGMDLCMDWKMFITFNLLRSQSMSCTFSWGFLYWPYLNLDEDLTIVSTRCMIDLCNLCELVLIRSEHLEPKKNKK